ncbi:tungsten ABC transporter permease [Comamonas thiooxydans]|nr:ABC-type tungstate transport system, permease component [Comamonas thiooxydans]MDO1473181.1 tungsten ABC transporter permease [Comamonas thiooxydans]
MVMQNLLRTSLARRDWLRSLAALGMAGGPALAMGAQPASGTGVQVAAVGGLVLCGVWSHVAEQASQTLAMPVTTVAAAPKEGVVPAFARGEAQMLLIHASDEAMALEASGMASAARVWGWNQHVIAGPAHDPAGVRSVADGTQALRRIAETGSPFIALRDPGSYTVVQRLWRRGGIRPDARWLRADTGPRPQAVLELAAREQAYAVVGHIPLAFGKMGAPGIELLLHGDPLMRRPYVLLTPGPRHPATAQQRQVAGLLAEYLLSAAGQQVLEAASGAGGPWVFGRDSVPAGMSAGADGQT